jgi:phosphatidate phosphatase LPIN
VIEKKPEEFKIACLKDIQTLFPSNPFYAGFGNKINDTWAYRAVGIHSSRIFTINHRGELKLELIQTFQSSYTRLSDVVDQMFPPLEFIQTRQDFLSEYSSFNYWRDPIEIELDDDLITSIVDKSKTNKSPNGKAQSPKA